MYNQPTNLSFFFLICEQSETKSATFHENSQEGIEENGIFPLVDAAAALRLSGLCLVGIQFFPAPLTSHSGSWGHSPL